jgi:O-antigen/teichoic acid export membrane protein
MPSWFHGLGPGLILVGAGSAPFAFSWIFASSVALATDDYELFAIPPALQAIVALAASVSLGAVDGVAGAVLGLTISHVAAAALTVCWCARRLPVHQVPEHGTGHLRRAVVFSLKGHMANAFTFFTYRLDIFVLNGVAAASLVGQYSIAVSVTQAVWLLPDALSRVVLPRIAQVSPQSHAPENDYQDIVQRKGVRHAAILAAGSSVALAAALLVVVLVVLGPRFHESIKLGLILLPGTALLGVSSALTSVMAGRGKPEYGLFAALMTTPVAVALYMFLIPARGATGAALASTLAYAFGFVISVVLGRRMLGRPMIPMILPTRDELDDYRSLAKSVLRRRFPQGDAPRLRSSA